MFSRKTDAEKAVETYTREREQEQRQAEENARRATLAAHVQSLPKWEYQVKRVGEDKQKGLLGSQRMEQLFNGEGGQGWELIAIHEERATFKRLRPPT